MNKYIETLKNILPLIEFSEGKRAQEFGIIKEILNNINLSSDFAVEFGERNLGKGTLEEIINLKKFSLLNIDCEAVLNKKIRPWTELNNYWEILKLNLNPFLMNRIFNDLNVPSNPAIVVIDVDSNDYWFLLALLMERRPSLIICEYNCHVDFKLSASLGYDPEFKYTKTKDYGASLKALKDLAELKGYKLCHIHGPLNLYFVDKDCIQEKENNLIKKINLIITENDFKKITDVELFYDEMIRKDERPTWYSKEPPILNKKPWINLEQIGKEKEIIHIDEIKLEIFKDDQGGQHYKQRSHKEDSVSRIWSIIYSKLKPSTLIDIGANYGFTSCLLSRKLNIKNVVAIEPDIRLKKLLNSNLENNLNGINYKVLNQLLSSEDKLFERFGINPKSTQDNRSKALNNWQEIIVPTLNFSSLLESINTDLPFFIKMDTQGNDVDIFISGLKILINLDNWITRIEFAPSWMESQGFNPERELIYLCSIFDVFESPGRCLWNATFESIFNKSISANNAKDFCKYVRSLNHNNLGWVDLFIFPKGFI